MGAKLWEAMDIQKRPIHDLAEANVTTLDEPQKSSGPHLVRKAKT